MHSAKLEGNTHLNPLTLDTEVQNLEFYLLGFGLVLTQYFLIVPLLLPFRMVIYILGHCTLEVYNLLYYYFILYFIGDDNEKTSLNIRRDI